MLIELKNILIKPLEVPQMIGKNIIHNSTLIMVFAYFVIVYEIEACVNLFLGRRV